jgi:hypothetical protein
VEVSGVSDETSCNSFPYRDGPYFYGGTNFYLVQLQPTCSLLKSNSWQEPVTIIVYTLCAGGEKLVSLNEKQRGFPTGLRVMGSQKYDHCVFEVKPSLEEAKLQEGEWMQIQLVEVWGCGGEQAKETQLRIKEWEGKEVLRRREVILPTYNNVSDCQNDPSVFTPWLC